MNCGGSSGAARLEAASKGNQDHHEGRTCAARWIVLFARLFRPRALLVWGRLNAVSQRGAGMLSRWVLSEVWRGDESVQGKRDVEKQQQ